MRQQGGLEDERCCTCGAELETGDHLFQCPKRLQFRRRLLAAFDDVQSKIDPCLYYIMYNGISNYITKGSNNSNNNNNNNRCDNNGEENKRKRKKPGKNKLEEYKRLIAHQKRIGWDNLLRGKISKGWGIMQKGYKMRQKYNEKKRRV